MAEYIERETLLQTLEEVGGCDAPPDSWADGWDKGISEAIKFVKELPAADVAEVRHGKWKRTDDGAAYCTNCKRKMNPHCYGYAYCSLCGARMDGDTK